MLALTEEIILELNSANYTVWEWRWRCIQVRAWLAAGGCSRNSGCGGPCAASRPACEGQLAGSEGTCCMHASERCLAF